MLSSKNKWILTIIILTIVLVIIQIYISNHIQYIQDELDDLNQTDLNFNVESSILSTVRSSIANSEKVKLLADVKNIINPVEQLTIEEAKEIGDNIKNKKSLIFWYNTINGFIITIEMFLVGILTTIVLFDKNHPLFETSREIVNNKEKTIIRAFPKHKLQEAAQSVKKFNMGVNAFKLKRSGLFDFVTSLFWRNSDKIYTVNRHIDTPRDTKERSYQPREEVSTIYE